MIVPLTACPDDIDPWPMIEEVFFLSASRRVFPSNRERALFFERWIGYYRDHEPDGIYLSLPPSGRLEGYLTGCRDSRAATRLYGDVDSYRLFEDLFDEYPAHFHVNCHPEFRGLGVGTRLVNAFLDACKGGAIRGVHVVTAVDADNIGFYRKCGFDFAVARYWRGRGLLFLATAL
jgi:GNAT superfamily N-acetyltransferase